MKTSSKVNTILAATAVVGLAIYLSSCATIPKGAKAVKPFKKEKYLGKWFEIARMDFKFERNLSQVTATYSLRNDGTIKVANRGFNAIKNEWKESVGKAKFIGRETEARLKVSFFGPFYAGYNVIAIDPEYKYALVAGKSLKYLWILSRDRTIPNQVKQDYLEKAEELGYDTDKLVWTRQD